MISLRNCPVCKRTETATVCQVCNGPTNAPGVSADSVMVRITSPTGTVVEYMEHGISLEEALDAVSMAKIEVFNPSGRLDRWGIA